MTTALTPRAWRCMEEIAAQIAKEVWVVAPEHDQSGQSHAISLHHAIRVSERGHRRFGVTGTPGDCAAMGICHLMKDAPPQLMLSGVNRGVNLGIEIGVLRHGRRCHDRDDAGRAGDRAEPGVHRPQKRTLGYRSHPRAANHPAVGRNRLGEGRLPECEFPAHSARRGRAQSRWRNKARA